MTGPANGTTGVADPERQLTEQGRERKRQIVESAMALFADRGYSATRISDICERAGVAKGLFYWYFPTKIDLFAELARSMRQRLRRAQADAMPDGASALKRISAGARASVRFIAEHANYFALIEVERADPAVAEALRGTSRVYLDDVIALVREGQASGDVVEGDPKLLAIGVLGAVSSYSNALRSGQIDVDVDELAAIVGDWVTRSLAG